MKPVLTVEFSAKAGDYEFKEESVTFHHHEEFFEFVAPGATKLAVIPLAPNSLAMYLVNVSTAPFIEA